MAKVSVIIGAYNPGPFLEATVRSVLDQTFTDWELIVVDDGSTEDLSGIARLHPRITFVRQENRGLSVARNAGLLRASGEYLAFLDQDDIWLPNKLQAQLDAMGRSAEVGLCYTSFERIDAEGRRIGAGFEGGAESYHDLLKGCCICVSTTLVRRSALASAGFFDPLYLGTQDYDMWLKIARQWMVCYLPQCLAQYRQHVNNLSRRYAELFVEIRHLFKWHARLARQRGDRIAATIARRALRRAYRVYGSQAFDHARGALRNREWRRFFVHFARASWMAPRFVAASLIRCAWDRASFRRSAPMPPVPGTVQQGAA